jgi:hypothetical protein
MLSTLSGMESEETDVYASHQHQQKAFPCPSIRRRSGGCGGEKRKKKTKVTHDERIRAVLLLVHLLAISGLFGKSTQLV